MPVITIFSSVFCGAQELVRELAAATGFTNLLVLLTAVGSVPNW